MDIQTLIATSLGAAWASGINLYATVAMLGLLGRFGGIDLPPGLEVVQHGAVIGAASVMYFVEFFADKIPGLDSAWDAIHTFIRIPAGAILAAQGMAHIDPALSVTAGLLGGAVSAGSHFTKAGSRALINTSPEPVSNWLASLGEDALVFAGLWGALHYPWAFFAFFALFVFVMILILPVIFKALRAIVRKIRGWFSGGGGIPSGAVAP